MPKQTAAKRQKSGKDAATVTLTHKQLAAYVNRAVAQRARRAANPGKPRGRKRQPAPQPDQSQPEPASVLRPQPALAADNPISAMLRPSPAPAFQAVIRPTPHVRELFRKRMRGSGGFQSFHQGLASRILAGDELVLGPADFHRLVNYATAYGEGGFQSALRWLVCLWVSESLPTIYGGASASQ